MLPVVLIPSTSFFPFFSLPITVVVQVKAGAENMIAFMSQPGGKRDRKLLADAQEMLADAKAKIEYIRMRINVAKENGSGDNRNRGERWVRLLMRTGESRL